MTIGRGNGTGAALSVVDSGSRFDGTYRSPGDLRVEGEFEGEIQCEGTLTVAASARVSGTISAGNVTVSGRLEGQITCSEKFEIQSSGQVSAGVRAGTVVIREGAFYEGDMRMHVAPEGLPERELTGATATTQESAPVEPTPLSAAPSARERADSALQAASE